MMTALHSVHRYAALLCSVMVMAVCVALEASVPTFTSSLGLPKTLNDFYIPGEKAEPIPRKDRESSLVIRVLEIKPAAEGFRYDLEIYGLDAGTYTLSDYFHYVGSHAPLPELDQQITITTTHDLQGIPKPEELDNTPPEKLGGYRLVLTLVGILWVIILLLILFWRKKKDAAVVELAPPPTLHEKLHALVSSAAQGELDDADRSQLERLILGHWKQRLPEIENLSASEALVALRRHPEASPLLLKLEHWLHAPNSSVDQKTITPLLEPFRDA
ncbi:hypothetical protein NT6N_09790 [Oceaniferula spumae]|uniref:Protein BatD n=1 Tax=Oceaniferula spumae TaxID=2979115 RepID=A0AAT9FIY8_9BACT